MQRYQPHLSTRLFGSCRVERTHNLLVGLKLTHNLLAGAVLDAAIPAAARLDAGRVCFGP